MPRQLDFCSACRAPIYMEHVEGACTCDLGKLRAIQAHLKIQQQERLQQIQAGVGAIAPPDLAAAVRAAAAARQTSLQQGQAPRVLATARDLEAILMEDARRATGGEAYVSLHTEEPASTIPEVSGQDYRRADARREYPVSARQQSMVNNRFALEALWDTREIPADQLEQLWVSDMEAEMAPGGPLQPDFTSEIQFDGEMDFEAGPRMESDREAVRFRVDRGTPQRTAFQGSVVGGSDGRTIGNARNFREIRELARQPHVEPGEMRREGPVTTRQATSEEVRRVVADGGRSARQVGEIANQRQRPTVYDRLRGSDPFDDD